MNRKDAKNAKKPKGRRVPFRALKNPFAAFASLRLMGF